MATQKKERGRPLKKPGSARTVGVLLRIGTLEKQAFKEASEIAGAPLSVWIRQRLRAAATQELTAIGRLVAFLEPPKAK